MYHTGTDLLELYEAMAGVLGPGGHCHARPTLVYHQTVEMSMWSLKAEVKEVLQWGKEHLKG